ncbi:hypothetical protein QYM36_000877 [Artemia franciscana]|uniref:Uncharacterized protein n=1 Tax=Artemia franciscana TaxID=6661 RepID=A0AA88LBD1_ARTSF|nr:hypothetical protein QYM36_000877 [Artemia franciscana]
MQAVDWEIVKVAESVDEKMGILKDVIRQSINSATKSKKRLVPKTLPRLDSKMKQLINRISTKFWKWRKTGLNSDHEEYKEAKNSVQSSSRKIIRATERKIVSEAKTAPKNFGSI